jgi:hypothetical protein
MFEASDPDVSSSSAACALSGHYMSRLCNIYEDYTNFIQNGVIFEGLLALCLLQMICASSQDGTRLIFKSA